MTEVTDNSAERCFLCKEPATYIRRINLYHPDDDRSVEAIVRGDAASEPQFQLIAYACNAHDDGLCDAIMARFGVAGGERLGPSPAELCPDPFHQGESEGEAITTEMGGGMWSEHYRCPTCGFETMQMSPPVPADDPAFVNATATLDAYLLPSQ